MPYRFLPTVILSTCLFPAMARAQATPEQVVVYGVLADSDLGLSPDRVPGTMQSLSAAELTAAHGPTVLDSLGTRVAGASLSDSQGNSMFQDLRLHGFEASPLQGTSQAWRSIRAACGCPPNWERR